MHPHVERAAAGELPEWAVVTPERREHIGRVATLVSGWAEALDLDPGEAARWRAAAVLHDAYRDEDPARLRPRVPPPLRDAPDRILHGPAAAERLRVEGVEDGELLRAVAYHTLGHAGFGPLGRAVYAGDFLEPGRTLRAGWRAALRARMPDDLDGVVKEILAARIVHQIESGRPLRPETLAFWNALAG